MGECREGEKKDAPVPLGEGAFTTRIRKAQLAEAKHGGFLGKHDREIVLRKWKIGLRRRSKTAH